MTVTDLIKRHEGLRLLPYVDSTGHRTIGYGHNLDADPLPSDTYEPDGSITTEIAENVLARDIGAARFPLLTNCQPWFGLLCDARQAVMIDCVFNMGWATFGRFFHTIHFIACGKYDDAADQMLASLWAKEVGPRANEDAEMMKTGLWPDGSQS